MSAPKFTPGPWKYRHDDEECIAPNVAWTGDIGGFQNPADGVLAAAAPELYAALRAIFENCALVHNKWGDGDNRNEADTAIKSARAALAKAEGRPAASSRLAPGEADPRD